MFEWSMMDWGIENVFVALVLWIGMLMVVEYSYRQKPEDRKFLRTCMGIVMILCAIWAGISLLTYPATALSISSEQQDSQMIFYLDDTAEGVPYKVWVNDRLLYDEYPGDTVVIDVAPGNTYTITAINAKNETASTTVKSIYYTYPVEIWLLLLLTILLALVAYWVPYAAFGAALTGGFLMLMVGTSADYAGYLRLIACTAFITGLGAIFIGGYR